MKRLAQAHTLLRALDWIYKTWHWDAGDYQTHLLAQRLYEPLDDEIDSLSEKMNALGFRFYGESSVIKVDASKTPKESATDAETRLLDVLNELLEDEELVTEGLANFIQGLLDQHENHLYLLKMAQ